jgi:hypothetical protein
MPNWNIQISHADAHRMMMPRAWSVAGSGVMRM